MILLLPLFGCILDFLCLLKPRHVHLSHCRVLMHPMQDVLELFDNDLAGLYRVSRDYSDSMTTGCANLNVSPIRRRLVSSY